MKINSKEEINMINTIVNFMAIDVDILDDLIDILQLEDENKGIETRERLIKKCKDVIIALRKNDGVTSRAIFY